MISEECRELFNDPEVVESLKRNDLNFVIDFIRANTLSNQEYADAINLMLDAGIDILGLLKDVIPIKCFYGSKIKTTRLPDGLKHTGLRSFAYCRKLEHITIPGSYEIIGMSTFRRCDNLKSVVIEEGVAYIKPNAFYECDNLESITIPESVELIEEGLISHSMYDKCVIKCKKGSAADEYASSLGMKIEYL